MATWIKEHKAAAVAIGVVGLGVIAWLAFGIFGVHTLFTDTTVSESGPVFSSATTNAPNAGNDTVAVSEPAEASAPAAQGSSPTATSAPVAATAAPDGGVTTVAQGMFSGADASHDVAGDAIVLGDGSGQRFLRLENFEATNGPDLKVYLRAADGDYVNLGALKGNIGDQNYEIPLDVDLATHSEVQIWCERFSVNFGSAFLA